jgi:hypothetical protein
MPEEKLELKLKKSIVDKIYEFAKEKGLKRIKSLSCHNPEKVAKVLYLYSQGVSQTQLKKSHNIAHRTTQKILVDYADHVGRWRDLGGKLAAQKTLEFDSLEQDAIDSIRERMHNGELKPTFRDLREISIAKEKSMREANTARGEATTIIEERKTVTQEDYEHTLQAAKKRILELKKGKAIDNVTNEQF